MRRPQQSPRSAPYGSQSRPIAPATIDRGLVPHLDWPPDDCICRERTWPRAPSSHIPLTTPSTCGRRRHLLRGLRTTLSRAESRVPADVEHCPQSHSGRRRCRTLPDTASGFWSSMVAATAALGGRLPAIERRLRSLRTAAGTERGAMDVAVVPAAL